MLDKILDMLKEEDGFISGEQMADVLNVSRNTICKYIAKLRKMGYDISSSTNKGYRLKLENNKFNKLELSKKIKTKNFVKNIYFFEDLDSTNEYAKTLADKLEDGDIVVCNNQTNGKGRLDRSWHGSKDKNIYMSLILKPNLELMNVWQITLLSGLLICQTIENILGIKAYIKWPNDIIINSKKVCGILTEVSAQIDRLKYIILGIGINVNEDIFDDSIKDKASSLYLEYGKEIDRNEFLALFLQNFEEIYFEYLENRDFKPYLEKYKSICINIGKEARIFSNNKVIDGKILDISDLGHLIVENEDGNNIILSGEVSIRNKNGKYI